MQRSEIIIMAGSNSMKPSQLKREDAFLSSLLQDSERDDHAISSSAKDLKKYYELELGQVVDRFNSLETFRVQLGSFFGTANLTAVGVGLSTQKAGIVLIASLILIIFMVIDRRLRLLTLSYTVRGIQLQRKLAPSDKETFLQVLPGQISDEAKNIVDLDSSATRTKAVRRSTSSYRSIFFLIPLVTCAGEITTAIVLYISFAWPLF